MPHQPQVETTLAQDQTKSVNYVFSKSSKATNMRQLETITERLSRVDTGLIRVDVVHEMDPLKILSLILCLPMDKVAGMSIGEVMIYTWHQLALIYSL